MRVLLAALAMCMLAIGCGPGFDPASLLERTRLVGARVEVGADPSVAWAHPGDDLTVHWWVAQPDAPVPTSLTTIACPLLPALRGTPVCVSAPFFVAPPSAPSTDDPVTTFTVPADLVGADVLLLGALCAGGGTPVIDAMVGSARCEGGDENARADLFVFSFPVVAAGEERNRHPSFDESLFTLEGAQWTAPPGDLPFSGCGSAAADPSLPRVMLPAEGEPEEVVIQLGVSIDARELYISTPMGGEPTERREPVQISHYASAGSMERFFTVVEGDDVNTQPREIGWTPPEREEVPDGGMLVRFVFVGRDLRGGFARADRALCLIR